MFFFQSTIFTCINKWRASVLDLEQTSCYTLYLEPNFIKREMQKMPSQTSVVYLVGIPSVLGPELASRRAEQSLLWRMSLYIFDILFLLPYSHVCVLTFMSFPLWLAVGPQAS